MKVAQQEQADIYQLLSAKKLSLNYQPVINFREHQVYCVEALLNWKTLRCQAGDTEKFISDIEQDAALSLRLDSCVLKTAMRDLGFLSSTYGYRGSVSVNISPASLANKAFLRSIQDLLLPSASWGPLDPSRLVLEITERVPWSQPERILESIAELTRLGVRIAVDDFITGYANFGVLLNKDVTIVKIDKGITERLLTDKSVQTFAAQFKELANHLNKTVIVEGIEECEQAMWLDKHGYQFFQGYFFAVPTNIQGIARYLKTQSVYRSGCA